MSRTLTNQTILNAADDDGVGVPFFVGDFRDVMLDVASASSADLVFKVQASMNGLDDRPDFAAAASATNKWFYIAAYDLVDPSSIIVGSTGVTLSGTDVVKGIYVNADLVNWVNVEISGYSAGTLTVIGKACTNA